jgi:hypothetical protein
MATEQQKAMLPTMTGGDGTAGLTEYQKEQLAIAAAIKNRAAGPPVEPSVGLPPLTGTEKPLGSEFKYVPPPPAPRKPAPDHGDYWVDAYGKVWRKLPEPSVILEITSDCSQTELVAIMNALLGGK